MKMRKTGQAALEFLTTYGWAFLVILVMIGGLSYFGVLDVSRFVPDNCKLDGNVECSSYALGNYTEDDFRIQLEVLNNMQDDIIITEVRIKEKGVDAYCTATNILNPDVVSSRTSDIEANFTGGQACNITNNVDKKKRFDLQVFYTKGSSTIENMAPGSLTTTVRNGMS